MSRKKIKTIRSKILAQKDVLAVKHELSRKLLYILDIQKEIKDLMEKEDDSELLDALEKDLEEKMKELKNT